MTERDETIRKLREGVSILRNQLVHKAYVKLSADLVRGIADALLQACVSLVELRKENERLRRGAQDMSDELLECVIRRLNAVWPFSDPLLVELLAIQRARAVGKGE